MSKPQEGKHFQSCIDLLLQLLNGYAIIWLCNQKINQTTREAFRSGHLLSKQGAPKLSMRLSMCLPNRGT